MNMTERMKEYLSNLSEEEKLDFCKKQVATVIRNFKSKEKAVKSEFDYNGSRTGVRGGKKTSLAAKSVNTTQMYFKSIEDLKLIVQYL